MMTVLEVVIMMISMATDWDTNYDADGAYADDNDNSGNDVNDSNVD